WLRPSKQIQPLIFSFKQPAQQRKIVATYELLYALLIGSLIALIVLPVNLFIIDGIKQCQSYTSTTACVNRKSISYAGVKPLKSNSCVNVCASSSNVPITAIDPVNVKIDITLNDQVNRALLELQVSKEDVYQSFCRKYQHHHHQLQQLVLGDIQVYPKKDTITFSSGLHSWASSLRQFSKHNQRTVPANNQYQDAIATKIQRLTIPEQRLGRPLLEKAEALGHSNGRSTETHPDLEVLLESLIPTSSKSATPASTSIASNKQQQSKVIKDEGLDQQPYLIKKLTKSPVSIISKRKSNDHSSDHLTDDHNTVRINQKQQGLLHLDLPSIH
ncbi:hypothetical protein MJO29_015074, partial [Puccinia striiformis f. sp. tritici]